MILNRGEKKSIVAKLIQNSSITCMTWLPDGQIIFGLADGKVTFFLLDYFIYLAHNYSNESII